MPRNTSFFPFEDPLPFPFKGQPINLSYLEVYLCFFQDAVRLLLLLVDNVSPPNMTELLPFPFPERESLFF